MLVVFAALAAFINPIRGGLLSPLPGGRILMGGLVWFAHSLPVGAAVAFGWYLWAVLGWGLYFAATNGEWREGEVEIKWIDKIGLRLFPFVTSARDASNFKRGAFCFGLRGLVMSLPMFLALAYLLGGVTLLLWPLFALQGVVYFLAGFWQRGKDPIATCEWAWGAVMGLIIFYGVL